MADAFSSYSTGLMGPITSGFSITPHDSNDLPAVTRQIRITGSGGNLAVVWADGGETVEPVVAGETLDWRIRRVKATGTTAAGVRGYV